MTTADNTLTTSTLDVNSLTVSALEDLRSKFITIDQAIDELSKLIAFGNTKLPTSTMIFNMGPAKYCPPRALNMCALCTKCYADKTEIQYFKTCLPYRIRQGNYWNIVDAVKFTADINKVIASHPRMKLDKLRFSESSDFFFQADVDKVIYIANNINEKIQTYVYSCRSDLNFSDRGKLVVNFSNAANFSHLVKNNCDNLFIAVPENVFTLPLYAVKAYFQTFENINYDKFAKCAGSCFNCSLCAKSGKKIIICQEH